ncbi:serine/threonine-protein kinase [Mycobacterium ulcerans]|uniref:serine/threonine-protein kinase n=1 Tax=Mycobacterium ulcerans TaxID=1809 RepID=UPI0008F90564|nr:serine/threonine-protein kinase [Mycobacterium ulcerans]MEB3905772.1 serine/threonine-protein kinase [Mycobacterium ulcerans]MEB3909952.1 serine/threonine-protein kinase [Mycobacterium ulcerans]MEB3920217.1 serine/threonine-protein kinase [Mycobacterium ulcerans]MEB3924281.1 serine/threonine-protein kinase [Mycobacterium ulcerans]MEB3928476.1 serine/threonine-protein kinase [Mycobacterium ulcerans]
MPLNEGDIFAGYVIQRLLGTGGMGEVYLAQHPRLPRLDALKILSLDATDDDEFRARFTREAELAATLWHPHIVGVHDRGEFDGRLWISMDYVDGTDTRHLVEQRYRSGMPLGDVIEIVTAVAEALDFAHERRLLHRDVKPANILVTEPSESARRRVLLTDFGIAREIDDKHRLTEAQMAIGTVAYAAPEQLTGRPLDGRADQYALAATAFHLLAGVPPFDHSNRAVVVGQHLNMPPPRISKRHPKLAHLDAAFAKALAKDPDDRYPRCIDFAKALAAGPGSIAEHQARRGATSTEPFDVNAEMSAEALEPARPSGTAPSAQAQPHPSEAGVSTASLGAADQPGAGKARHTKRLERMTVDGTAVSVQKRPAGPEQDEEVWLFCVQRYESTGEPHTVIPVELRGTSITGQLANGDAVGVSGIWDGSTLFADAVVNYTAANRGRRRSSALKVEGGLKEGEASAPARPPGSKSRKGRAFAIVAALLALAAIAVAAVLTHGFGLWSTSEPGPVVKAQQATVFSPGGTPDHPGQAGLAIDGDPNSAWPTDTYVDATPFPAFKQGVGLILRLAKPTALSEVTIDVPSTGTEVQIRAAGSATPASLSDTTALTPNVALHPGHNRIRVDSTTKTANVLVWISKLGTTKGESRNAISDITLRAR